VIPDFDVVGQDGDVLYFMCAVDALGELQDRLAVGGGH
jgi:hypothetical protein